MKQLVLLLAIIYGSTFHTYAQKKDECPILGGTTDTVMCGDKKLILDLKFCESNGLYQYGILTDTNGNEEFCFYYKYDHQNNLNKITFWTFQWITSGYTTEEKIGVLKIRGDNQELIIKKGYTLSRDFVKLVTKT